MTYLLNALPVMTSTHAICVMCGTILPYILGSDTLRTGSLLTLPVSPRLCCRSSGGWDLGGISYRFPDWRATPPTRLYMYTAAVTTSIPVHTIKVAIIRATLSSTGRSTRAHMIANIYGQ